MFLAEANPLNSSALVFPILECMHIVGWALLVGTIGLVDFRLLGFGLRRQTAAETAKDLAPWTLLGLAIILLSGPLLFSSDPDMYYLNRSFQFKMVCFVLAVTFNYTLHRKMVRAISESELAHQALQILRHPREVLGGGGHLFRRGSGTLSDLVHVL